MHTAFTRFNMADMDAAAHELWSRSAGLLSQAGNADSELKTRVADGVADDFRLMARGFGMGTSEFLRIMVLTRLYGVDGVSRMTSKHIGEVAGVGPTNGPAKTPTDTVAA